MRKPEIVFLDAGTVGSNTTWPDFSILGNVVLHAQTSPDETFERIAHADFVLTNKVVISAQHISTAKKLSYIGSLATGYNHVDAEAAAARGIPVCNVPGYSTPTVMQHVFALLLALTSRVCDLNASIRRGEWTSSPYSCSSFKLIAELGGKTMGIAGFGDIGQQVGITAHAFGMKVIAYTPRPKAAPHYGPFAFVGLEELFRQADVVSLHCPLTEENAGMINARTLGMMKETAYLINTARGQLVNEDDLRRTLEDGNIAGAGLDVVAEEPITNSNPLLGAPNCIITPHIAWASAMAKERLLRGVYENIKNFMDGNPSNVQNGIQKPDSAA